MLKSYWIIAVAFGLAFSVSQGYAQDQENTQEIRNTQQAEQQKPSFVAALEDIELAIRGLISAESQRRRDAQVEQSAAGLVAQQEMADWAQEVALGTIAGAIFTFGGLILIWRTLKHSRRAADYAYDMVVEAKATTAAAEETVIVTRDIGRKQVRAYISVIEVSVICVIFRGEIRWVVEVDLQNSGQSPAIGVKLKASMDQNPERSKSSILLGDLAAGMSIQEEVGQATSASELKFVGDDQKRAAIRVSVLVTAEDVFGDPIEVSAWYAGTVRLAHGAKAEIRRGREIHMMWGLDDNDDGFKGKVEGWEPSSS